MLIVCCINYCHRWAATDCQIERIEISFCVNLPNSCGETSSMSWAFFSKRQLVYCAFIILLKKSRKNKHQNVITCNWLLYEITVLCYIWWRGAWVWWWEPPPRKLTKSLGWVTNGEELLPLISVGCSTKTIGWQFSDLGRWKYWARRIECWFVLSVGSQRHRRMGDFEPSWMSILSWGTDGNFSQRSF